MGKYRISCTLPGVAKRFIALAALLIAAAGACSSSSAMPAVQAAVPAGGGTSGSLKQIVPGVYLYKDTCNVYAIVKGQDALLIDFGSGRILDQLPTIGVRNVGWILHTHFHRR